MLTSGSLKNHSTWKLGNEDLSGRTEAPPALHSYGLPQIILCGGFRRAGISRASKLPQEQFQLERLETCLRKLALMQPLVPLPLPALRLLPADGGFQFLE